MGNAEKTMWTTKTKLVESWAEHYRAKTKEEKKRIFERMLKKNNKRVSGRKSKVIAGRRRLTGEDVPKTPTDQRQRASLTPLQKRFRGMTAKAMKRNMKKMLKAAKKVAEMKKRDTDASPTNVTRPCDCEWGTAYKKNGFIPLAEDSDECGKCRGTGEVTPMTPTLLKCPPRNESKGRRLVEVAYYGFIAVLLSLMCLLAAAVYMIYRQRDAKPHHLARIDSHRVQV